MKVLITGASGYFGKLLAHSLRTDSREKVEVVGVDVRESEERGTDEMKFLSGDTRKKRIEDIFKTEGKIDTVIHLARDSSAAKGSDASMMTNVYGTFHMLEVARKYGVKQFIFPSSSVVYGAHMDNPALIREDHPLLGNRDVANIRDRVEADMICQTFAHGIGDMKVVILRIVPIWRTAGAGTLSRYMKGDTVPTFLGFDPMFQLVYDDEVLEAFRCAVSARDASGPYNIHGRIFMPLSKVIKHLGKKPLPLPEFLVHKEGKFLWSKNLRFDFNYLKFPFTLDGTKAKEELGYNPAK